MELKEGSEGTINVETKEVVEVKADSTEVEMGPVMEEEVEVEEPVMTQPVEEVVFIPATFDKLKDLKGRQVKLEGIYSVEKYGVKAKKGVILNGDLYFVSKKQKYVIHEGELIKIDGISDVVGCDIVIKNNGSSTGSVKIYANGSVVYAAGVEGGGTIKIDTGNNYGVTYKIYTKTSWGSWTEQWGSGCGTYYI